MGSFDVTCAVSNFPIGCGDKIRYMWLTPYPYKDPHEMNPWTARTTPLRAEYGDYGRPEGIKKTVALRLWMESLKHDLIEVGVGDNSCHDVATSKDMSFEQAQEAVWEGRLLVKRDATYSRARTPDEAARLEARRAEIKGRGPSEQAQLDEKLRSTVIPTLQSVTTILKDAGMKVNAGGDGFLVDEVDYGFVRVRDCTSRFDRKGDNSRLENVQAILAHYATMLAAGSGNYADDAEVLVLAKPGLDPVKQGKNQFEIRRHRKEEAPAPLKVSQCFIREDVWQILLHRPFNESYEFTEGDYEIDKLKEYALQLFEHHVTLSGFPFHMAFTRSVLEGRKLKNPMIDAIVPEFRGISAAHLWKMLVDKVRHGEKVSDKQIIQFVHDYTEMYRVAISLELLRQGWKPSPTMGGQHGEMKLHRSFHRELAHLGTKRAIQGSHKSEGRALNLTPPKDPDGFKIDDDDDD